MKTGNLDVRTGAMVREVLVGSDGLASGVSYVDKKTRSDVTVKAKIVVLAASCCETARIMLNSKSSLFPNGVANSSGLVGKYLMDTVGSDVSGYLPILEDLPPQNEDGVGGMHMYMPWWNYKQQKDAKMPFARGYHIEMGGGREMPGLGIGEGTEEILGGGYGAEFKRNLRKIYGCEIGFAGRGEMIPNDNSYCEIDPKVVDEWGIPVLRFHFKWSDDEILQAKHMQETFQEIIETCGGRVTENMARTPIGASHAAARSYTKSEPPGWATIPRLPSSTNIARPGIARTCSSPMRRLRRATPTKIQRSPSPALGWRTSEHIADQVKKLNLSV